MRVKVKFARENEFVKVPSKRDEDGAFDLFADLKGGVLKVIKPHTTESIPTGLRTSFEKGYVLILKERGSTGTKGMGQRAGVVDSGYRGEIFVPITNHNDREIWLYDDNVCLCQEEILAKNPILYPISKGICQAMIIPVPAVDFEEITVEELTGIASERGEACLGSTNK